MTTMFPVSSHLLSVHPPQLWSGAVSYEDASCCVQAVLECVLYCIISTPISHVDVGPVLARQQPHHLQLLLPHSHMQQGLPMPKRLVDMETLVQEPPQGLGVSTSYS